MCRAVPCRVVLRRGKFHNKQTLRCDAMRGGAPWSGVERRGVRRRAAMRRGAGCCGAMFNPPQTFAEWMRAEWA
jgi:hypothetical protein